MASLKGVTPDVLDGYMKRVRENNISGLVLQNCDLDELRPVLQMRFGDWQLFRAAILSLREWEGMLEGESTTDPSNNSAAPTVSSSPEGGKMATATVSRQSSGSSQSGQGMTTKGRRMHRTDSIVQQLSYEAAILHEALEEFSEESDREEAEVFSSEAEAGTPSAISINVQASPSADFAADDPNKLSSLITVLDAPNTSSGGTQYSPFVLQSSFPSGAQLPGLGDGEKGAGPDAAQLSHDSHRPHHLLKTLSSGLGKIARPIIHAFDHHGHQHHGFGEEGGEMNADKIALMPMSAELTDSDTVVQPAEVLQEAPFPSPWDRHAFTSSADSPTAASRSEVTVDIAAPPKPLFRVGSVPSSPTSPSPTSDVSPPRPVFTLDSPPILTIESEMLESTRRDSSGFPSNQESPRSPWSQEGEGLWQLQSPQPSTSQRPPDVDFSAGKDSSDRDKESCV